MWETKLKKVHHEEPQLAHSPRLGLCHYQFRTYLRDKYTEHYINLCFRRQKEKLKNDIYHRFNYNSEVSFAVSQGYIAPTLCQMSNSL